MLDLKALRVRAALPEDEVTLVCPANVVQSDQWAQSEPLAWQVAPVLLAPVVCQAPLVQRASLEFREHPVLTEDPSSVQVVSQASPVDKEQAVLKVPPVQLDSLVASDPLAHKELVEPGDQLVCPANQDRLA